VLVHQLFIDFEKAYDLVRREVMCNVRTESDILMKPVRLIKMWLKETCNKVGIGRILHDPFPIPYVLKQRDALSAELFNYFWTRWWEAGEDCIMRSFVTTCTFHQIL
jgi:hypothetical protein